jgi:DNA invertase Pin-like site-specific DNA recombinase
MISRFSVRRPDMMLRKPIEVRHGRKLRVLTYARFSTLEQDHTSVEDQHSANRRRLAEWGIDNAEVTELSDEAVSGELHNRPGIDLVRAGIQRQAWDLILAEDSSRLFRVLTSCVELVQDADDADIRVILPNDRIDTSEDDWLDRLCDVQRHHQRDNYYTRLRLRRKIEGLWSQGAAVGPLRPGFRRRASRAATARDPEKGPFFDEVNQTWRPIICEAFERVAANEPLWSVAAWLTTARLPKTSNSLSEVWSARNVIELIRNPIYRGEELYGKLVTKRKRGAKPKQVASDPDKVCRRRMEHLRMVGDALWFRANRAIDQRNTRKRTMRGSDHPLTGIPRDSRGPLSQVLVCGRCGEKAHADGRIEGGYRCSQAGKHLCWNRATVVRSYAHEQIGNAIASALIASPNLLDALITHASQLATEDQTLTKLKSQRESKVRSLVLKRDRLLRLFEDGQGEIQVVGERLKAIEQELIVANSELQEACELITNRRPVLSREEIEDKLRQTASSVLSMDREVSFLLPRLIQGKIRLVPYRRRDHNAIVLRAAFQLRSLPLALSEMLRLLSGGDVQLSEEMMEDLSFLIDLFPADRIASNAKRAAELKAQGMTIRAVSHELALTERASAKAIQLGKLMQADGSDDPFVEVIERPASASRWRFRDETPEPHNGEGNSDAA